MNAVAAVAAYDGETVGLSVFLNDITHLSVPHARPHFRHGHTFSQSVMNCDTSHDSTSQLQIANFDPRAAFWCELN